MMPYDGFSDIECLFPWIEADHAAYVTDWSAMVDDSGRPLAIAFPKSTQDVVAVMRHCHANGLAVVPQGGRTGLAGGAVPNAGSVVVSLEKMNRIEEVDPAGSLIVVEAGVLLESIQDAADAVDLFFPLDLGARGSCMIGGNLATNAGGNRVLRYGMVRDLTLGIEAVTADGTVLNAMNRMTKNNSGYDLKQVFIGSEGTLGIITRAVLKLMPKPRTQQVALCALDDYAAVLAFLALARARLGSNLSAFEVMWDSFFDVARKGVQREISFEQAPPFVVLIEAMGRDDDADAAAFQDLIEQAFEDALLADGLIAQNQRDITDFWALRDASGELARLFGPAVNFDVSVPVAELDRFAKVCRAKLAERLPGISVLAFGHIADGNIHFACLDKHGRNHAVIEETIYALVGEWNGAITAEHGVGLEKRHFLQHSRDEAYVGMMRSLKAAFDPLGLMNPGKIFISKEN